MPDSKATVRRRWLGAELRQLRESAGLTLDEAGKRLERADSTISRVENGRVRVHPREVEAMLDLYGLTDTKKREALLALARESRKRGWWHTYGDVLSDPYLDFISLESDAISAHTYESQLIPGLLQTEDYARAIIGAVPRQDANIDIDRLVAVRMARQQVLTRKENPLKLWVVLDEAALRRPMGGAAAMRAQLQHLARVAEQANVTLQVLPYWVGTHAGINGPFTVLGFPAPANLEVVLVENLTSSLYLEQEEDVHRYMLVFNHLRASALPTAESLDYITRLAEDL